MSFFSTTKSYDKEDGNYNIFFTEVKIKDENYDIFPRSKSYKNNMINL